MCSDERLEEIRNNSKISITEKMQEEFNRTKEEVLKVSENTTRLFRSILL